MKVACLLSIIAVAVLVTGCAIAQTEDGVINIRDFAEHAVDVGTDQENWQPAFQEALKLAADGQRPIYVPAGEYKIRRAITIRPVERPGGGWYHGPRIYGDGMYQSRIAQEVDSENCIDWTGEIYENSAKNGQIERIWLNGGRITLNLKWHNAFKLEACRVSGASEYGIYTEGWSSRFLNSVIRRCGEAGFYGRAHYNNAVIRDCYFSRCKIGALIHGGHGSRISGSGFEQCFQNGVDLRNVKGFTIADTYFEGNGNLDTDQFEVRSPANMVEIGFNCWRINIHDSIFRAQGDPNGGMIAISDVKGAHIYDNLFWINRPVQNGILLLEESHYRPDWDNQITDLVVENNTARNVKSLLTEQVQGLVEKARQNGSSFQWEIGEEAPE